MSARRRGTVTLSSRRQQEAVAEGEAAVREAAEAEQHAAEEAKKAAEAPAAAAEEEDEADEDDGELTSSNRFLQAAGRGDTEKVRFFLTRSDAHERDEHGNTALFHAAWYNHVEVVELLLHHMVTRDLNVRNENGSTALHYAVAMGKSHTQIVIALVQAGSDIYIKNNQGKTPQDLVREHPQFKGSRHIRNLFHLVGARHMASLFASSVANGELAERRRKLNPLQAGVDTTRSYKGGGTGLHDDVHAVFRRLTRATDVARAAEARAAGEAAPADGGDDPLRSPARTRALEPDDLAPLLELLGVSLNRAEMRAVMEHMDVNGDGEVDADDFMQCMIGNPPASEVSAHHAVELPFAALDANGDGTVGLEDLIESNRRLRGALCLESAFEARLVVQHSFGHGTAHHGEEGGGEPASKSTPSQPASRRHSVIGGTLPEHEGINAKDLEHIAHGELDLGRMQKELELRLQEDATAHES